jgi:hypothetical protein
MPHPNGILHVNYKKQTDGTLNAIVILPKDTNGRFIYGNKEITLSTGKNNLMKT